MNAEAMVLTGGNGARLQGVVSDRPKKPMAGVSGRPFLEWLPLGWRSQGLQRFVPCTGHMAEMVEAHFGGGAPWGVEVRCSADPIPLSPEY